MKFVYPAIIAAVFAILALLFHPAGPYGWFWPIADICPLPTLAQYPFFIGLAIFEAFSFGIGLAFLFFGYPYVRLIFTRGMAISVWIAISWLMINWFPHNSMHMNAGIDMWRMVIIDYAFHVTLIVAGCFMIYAFVSRIKSQTG